MKGAATHHQLISKFILLYEGNINKIFKKNIEERVE